MKMATLTYFITPSDGATLNTHYMKPAETSDKDENGEKGDPIYQEVFVTTQMPVIREKK
jgi:hypothetical protein